MEHAEGKSTSMEEQIVSHQEQLSRPLINQVQKLHGKEEAVPCNHQLQTGHQIPDLCKQYDVNEMPKKPIKQLTQEERDYWQQRLPRGFQFYLERLARGVIRNQPENIKEFAAGYLEELLVSRNAELWKLPVESYFTKLYKKKTLKSPWQPKRHNFGRSAAEQSPISATVFPDLVPEENLPISTLGNQTAKSAICSTVSYAEKKENDFTQELMSTCESNEILTADDCHSALEESLIIQGPITSQTTNSISFETAEETLSAVAGSEIDINKFQESKKKHIFLQMQSEETERRIRRYTMEKAPSSSPVDGIEYSDLNAADMKDGNLEKMPQSNVVLCNTTINNNKPIDSETKMNEKPEPFVTLGEDSMIEQSGYWRTDAKTSTKCEDELQQVSVSDMYITRFSTIEGALHQTKYFLNGLPKEEDPTVHAQDSALKNAGLGGESQTLCCPVQTSGDLSNDKGEKNRVLWPSLTKPYQEAVLVSAKGDQNHDSAVEGVNKICHANSDLEYESSSQSCEMPEDSKNFSAEKGEEGTNEFQSADSSRKEEEDSIGEDIQARFRAESEIYFIPIRTEEFLNEMNLENGATQKCSSFEIQVDAKSSSEVSSFQITGTHQSHDNCEHPLLDMPQDIPDLPAHAKVELEMSSPDISKEDLKDHKSYSDPDVQKSDTQINQDLKESGNGTTVEQMSALQGEENQTNLGCSDTKVETNVKMACIHQSKEGKSNMEDAISIANSYISELKKVAQNIERILDEQNNKGSEKGSPSSDNIKKRKKVGSQMSVEELSHKVLTMYKNNVIKDSVEYRMGDYVFKIKRVKKTSRDKDSRSNQEKGASNECEPCPPTEEEAKKTMELNYSEGLTSFSDTLQEIPTDANNNNQWVDGDIACKTKGVKSCPSNSKIAGLATLLVNQNNNGNFLSTVDSKSITEQLVFSPVGKGCLNYPEGTGSGAQKPTGRDNFCITKDSKKTWRDHDPSCNSSSNNSQAVDRKAKKLYSDQEAISYHDNYNYSTNNLIRDQEDSLLSQTAGTRGSLPTPQLTALHFKRQQNCPSEKDRDREQSKNRYYHQPSDKQAPAKSSQPCNKSVFCKEGMKDVEQKNRGNENHQECQKDGSDKTKPGPPSSFDDSEKCQPVQKFSKPMTVDEQCPGEADTKNVAKHSHSAATYTSNPRGISLQETASQLMAKAKDNTENKDIKSPPKILEIDITALNVPDYLPKILKKEFPLRLHSFQEEYNLSSSYMPEVTRQITLQSPEENMMVHTIHTRPNPLQPELRGDFEIASLKKRIYLGEKDGFYPSEGTRRLICETECYSTKDPKTQNLILENGTLPTAKASKVNVQTKPGKRKKTTKKTVVKEAVKPIQNDVSELTGISKVVAEVTKEKEPQWFNKDYIQLIGDVLVIGSGKTRNIEQISRPLQEGDGSNNSSNTPAGFCVGPLALQLCQNNFTIERRDASLSSSKWRSLHLRNITYENSNNNNTFSFDVEGSATAGCSRGLDYFCDHFEFVSHDRVFTETGYRVVNIGNNSSDYHYPIKQAAENLSQNIQASFSKSPSLKLSDLKGQLSSVSTLSDDFTYYDCNNNSTAKLSDVDDATLQDIDQIPTEQTPAETKKAKSSRRSRPNSPNKKIFRGSCPDCEPAYPGDAHMKDFDDFQNQVLPTDINVSDIAQTGSSLALRKNLLPEKSLAEKTNLRGHKLWNPCSCDPPRPRMVPQYAECGVQLNIGDVCPSTGSQVGDSGLYKTYTGHIIKVDQVAMCECQIKSKHRPLCDFDMQVSAEDICPSSDVQTGSSLLLLEPFTRSAQQAPPIDYNDGKEHTLKGHVLKETCDYLASYHCTEQVEAREIETQVTAIEINPCDEVQTGDSLMLTEPFPPVKPTLSDDESADGDMTWADLSIYDMTPEHRSVNAYYKRFDDYPSTDKDYVIYPSQYKPPGKVASRTRPPPVKTPEIVVQQPPEDKLGKMKMTGGDVAPYRIDEDQLSYDGSVKDFIDKENLTKDGKHVSDDDYKNYVKEVYKKPEDLRDHEQGEFRNVPRRFESLTITSYEKETVDPVRGPMRRKYTNFGAGKAFKDMKEDEEVEAEEAEAEANGETKGSEGHRPYKRKRRITVGPSVSTQTVNTPSNTLKSGFY